MRSPHVENHLRAGTAAAVLGVAVASLLGPGATLGAAASASTVTTSTVTTGTNPTTTDTTTTPTTTTSTDTTTTPTTSTQTTPTTTDTTPTTTVTTPTTTDTTPTTTDTTPTTTDTTATDTTTDTTPTTTDTTATDTTTDTTPTTTDTTPATTETAPTTTTATTTVTTTSTPSLTTATKKTKKQKSASTQASHTTSQTSTSPSCSTTVGTPRGTKQPAQQGRCVSQTTSTSHTSRHSQHSTPAKRPAKAKAKAKAPTVSIDPIALTPETIPGPPAESSFAPFAPLPTLSPQLSRLTASALKLLIKTFPVPPFLLPIYQAASIQYGVPWQVLAAINEIETNFGRDLAVSSAGAEGWMQFLPSTWASFGVDADGRGKANPYDPIDAIFAAARYLRAAGASTSLPNAIFAYNHAGWYVNSVELRARLLQALPQGLVDGLLGLMQASYPVAGHLGRDATAAPRLLRLGGHPAASIAAPGNAAVIAGADSRVVAIGESATLGHFVTLKDSYGDLITYGGLGEVATVYPLLTPQVESSRQLAKGLGLRAGRRIKHAKKLPAATRLSAASFSGLPTSTATDRKAIASERSTRGSSTVSATRTGGALVKERLFADPSRPGSYAAGGNLQLQSSVRSYLLGANGKLGRASDVLSHQVRLTEGQFTLAPLTVGTDVVAGTVVGRTSGHRGTRATVLVEVKPAGAAAAIDPRAVIASWRLLGQLTGGTRALSGSGQGSAYDTRNASLGQLLLSDRVTLQEAVLNDPHLVIGTCDRDAIGAGEVDTRILGVLEYLSYSGLAPTVTGLAPNDSGLSCAAPAGSGPRFEITALDGISVRGHQRAGGVVDLADRQLLALQGRLAPSRVISLRRYPWQSEALSLPDHAADIEVDFGSANRSSARSLRAAWARLTKRLNQLSGS